MADINEGKKVISPSELDDAATKLESISNELKECFDRITSSVENIRANWTDQNGREFSNRYDNEVKPKLRNYYDAIMEHSNFVCTASRIYKSTIDNIHSSVA